MCLKMLNGRALKKPLCEDEFIKKVFDAMDRIIPLRHMGTPEDIGAAVTFLASDEAGFITGQTLSVSGGLTMA